MKIFYIVWTIIFLIGALANYKRYSIGDYFVLIFLYSIPFILKIFSKKNINKTSIGEKTILSSSTKEDIESINTVSTSNRNYQIENFNGFNIPSNILDLLWFADGKFENYNFLDGSEYNFGNINIKILSSGDQEPSLIFSKLPISFSKSISPIDKIGYYPSYSTLTPEQRYIYLKWLENPFKNTNIDIGYVFLFYYGLERHLFLKNSEKALMLILKLLTIYKNSSFFSYAFECVCFFCICTNNYENLKKLIGLHPENTPLQIYSKYICKMPLYSEDLISLSSKVEFKNKRYIKMYPDLFNQKIEKNLNEILGQNYIELDKFYNNTSTATIYPVANYSLRKGQDIKIPDLLSNKNLNDLIFRILVRAHEDVKSELKEKRSQAKTVKK